MGNPRPKSAAPAVQDVVAGMRDLLTKNGFQPIGEPGGAAAFAKPGRGQVIIDEQGWTSQDDDGKETDFGSSADDLVSYLRAAPEQLPDFDQVHYIHHPPEDQTERGNYFSVVLFKNGKGVFSQLVDEEHLDRVVGRDLAAKMRRGVGEEVRKPNVTGETNPYKALDVGNPSKEFLNEISAPDQGDKEFLQSMKIKSKLMRKGYTMTNQGYGTNSKCYKCQQQIEEGQLSTWEGGMECHAGGCPRPAQQPQQTPSQRIQNMPQRGKPKSPAQLGLQPKSETGYAPMASSKKKAVGLQNQGQPDAVCPKCQQPIAEGQMVNYPQGKETHVQCPPATGQQPGQGAPGSGYESRLNLPPGFKRPQPQQQAKTPGMISPNVGAPRAANLLEKKADSRFIDDEWRAILEHYGFKPEGQPNSEIWWNQEIPVRIKIDNDPEGNAFWVAMTNEGNPLESGSDTHRLEMQLESIAASLEPKEEITWKDDVPEFSDADKDFMKDFKIKGHRIAKVTKGKKGARKPNFGFAVPLKAAGNVAFHLAKSGMKDFEVIHYEDDASSVFAFTNEPEMHLGEEIVRAEFQDQIASRKGMWASWSQSAKTTEDPSLVKSEQELHAPTASDKTAGLSAADRGRLEDHIARMTVAGQYKDKKQLAKEILNHVEEAMRGEHGFDSGNEQKFLRGKKFGPKLVESSEEGGYEQALQQALAALDKLAEIGPSEDIAGCAAMSAGDLRGFEEDYRSGNARKFSSDGGKTVYCCVLGHLQMTEKTSSFEKRALDANLVTLIGSFVGAVLTKWLGQEYSKRWGSLAEKAQTKAIQALQNKGVYDLGTLDAYAEENGTSQIGAFMRLCGQSLLLAAAMTTGIAGAKLLSGGAAAPAAQAQSQQAPAPQMTITDEVDAPAPQAPAPQPSQSQLKQQQKQRDQQVMQQLHEQDEQQEQRQQQVI